MKKLATAIFINIAFIGMSLVWPQYPKSNIHPAIEPAYSSICHITTTNNAASGILLESGYILTAAHVIDRNHNGKIDDNEKTVQVEFPSIGLITTATAIAVPNAEEQIGNDLDIAVLTTEERVPLRGSKLLTIKEYEGLQLGTPVSAIGYMNNDNPPSITHGNLTNLNNKKTTHRCSTTVYYGSSGGGVFTSENNRLLGIAVRVGIGHNQIIIPVWDTQKRVIVGQMQVGFRMPIANSALYLSAPAIQGWLTDNGMDNVLEVHPPKCPYRDYFKASLVLLLSLISLLMVFKTLDRWIL